MPEADAAYDRRIATFTHALERLTVAAGFLVSRGDGVDEPYHTYINNNIRTFARKSFLDADRAQGALAPRPWLRGPRGKVAEYESRYEPVLAAVAAYPTAMTTAWSRWGCKTAAFRESDGGSWIGRIYPDGFPRNTDCVRPRELDMLRLTLSMLKLFRTGGGQASPETTPFPPPRPPDLENATKAEVLAFIGKKSPRAWKPAERAHDKGQITLMEVESIGGGRSKWRVWKPALPF